ncbi:O-antigen ligase family protein [bacterium]|nr:O-antigen ligase family protein [bacterium]
MADEPKTLSISDPRLVTLLGATLMSAAVLTVAGWMFYPLIGMLMLGAWMGLALIIAAWQRPMIMLWPLWAAGLYNYGVAAGGAIIKPTELIQIAMIGFIVMRITAGDRDAIARLARAGWLVLALGLIGVIAVASAAPHPNFFNVRYEVFNYGTLVYALLFFRARDWKMLLSLFVIAVAAEAWLTLVLRFFFNINGLEFLGERGGVFVRYMNDPTLELMAGGRNRLSGTMTHKNMLAAFFVLLLPLISVEMLRHKRFSWLAAVIPALAALALSDSMTGWVAMVIVIALLLVFLRRFDYLAIMSLFILPALAVGIWKFGEPIFYRTQQLFGSTEGYGTVSSRFEILNISLRLIEDYPWLGIGRNNFLLYGQTYYTHAHNLFLMKIIEMGIPGGLMFIGVFLSIYGRIWWAMLRETARLSAQGQYYHVLGLTLGLTGILAMNMLDYNYIHFSLGPMITVLMGVALAVSMDLPGVAEPNKLSL